MKDRYQFYKEGDYWVVLEDDIRIAHPYRRAIPREQNPDYLRGPYRMPGMPKMQTYSQWIKCDGRSTLGCIVFREDMKP
jgi:hypothetical protein